MATRENNRNNNEYQRLLPQSSFSLGQMRSRPHAAQHKIVVRRTHADQEHRQKHLPLAQDQGRALALPDAMPKAKKPLLHAPSLHVPTAPRPDGLYLSARPQGSDPFVVSRNQPVWTTVQTDDDAHQRTHDPCRTRRPDAGVRPRALPSVAAADRPGRREPHAPATGAAVTATPKHDRVR